MKQVDQVLSHTKSEEQITQALINAHGNVEMAVTLLLENPPETENRNSKKRKLY